MSIYSCKSRPRIRRNGKNQILRWRSKISHFTRTWYRTCTSMEQNFHTLFVRRFHSSPTVDTRRRYGNHLNLQVHISRKDIIWPPSELPNLRRSIRTKLRISEIWGDASEQNAMIPTNLIKSILDISNDFYWKINFQLKNVYPRCCCSLR